MFAEGVLERGRLRLNCVGSFGGERVLEKRSVLLGLRAHLCKLSLLAYELELNSYLTKRIALILYGIFPLRATLIHKALA